MSEIRDELFTKARAKFLSEYTLDTARETTAFTRGFMLGYRARMTLYQIKRKWKKRDSDILGDTK